MQVKMKTWNFLIFRISMCGSAEMHTADMPHKAYDSQVYPEFNEGDEVSVREMIAKKDAKAAKALATSELKISILHECLSVKVRLPPSDLGTGLWC